MRIPPVNFEGDPWVPLLNFERGPGVPLLNFREVPGPTFKLWGGSQVPGPSAQSSEFRGPGPTFTPCRKFNKEWTPEGVIQKYI